MRPHRADAAKQTGTVWPDPRFPALPADDPVEQTQDVYWSSTTSVYESDWAWAHYLDKGALDVGHKPFARFAVWSVCDSVISPGVRTEEIPGA